MNKLTRSISLILFAGVMLFALSACSSRAPIDLAKVRTICQNLELTMEDESAKSLVAQVENNLTQVVIAQNEACSIQAVIFTDEASAKNIYASINSSLSIPNSEVVKKIDSATYNKLYVKSNEAFAGVVRIQNTLFYGEDSGSGTVEKILADLGY